MSTPPAPWHRLAPHARTAASALLVAASLPPWDLPFVAGVALVPWLSGLARCPSVGRAVVQGFWLSFGLGLLVAHWMATAAAEFLQLPTLPSLLVLLLFAATSAWPHLLGVAPLVRFAARQMRPGEGFPRVALVCVGLALVYTGLDQTVPRLFDVGFGYALHDAPQLRQLAALGGVPLLTTGLVLVNLLAWWIWSTVAAGHRALRSWAPAAAAIALLWACGWGYGLERSRSLAAAVEQAEGWLEVGVVQGNVPNAERLAWARGDERAAEQQLGAYMQRTESLLERSPRPDLVVWPEATFPGVFGQPASRLQRGREAKFERQRMRLDRPVLFGAYDREGEGASATLYNALFLLTPDERRGGAPGIQRYRKHRLLPFAERFPGLDRSSPLRRWLPNVGAFGRGPGPQVLRVGLDDGRSLGLGPILCSESLSPGHALEAVHAGADVLVNVGSDGWFGPHGEPQLHLAVARMRSVETGRPQVRVANTGISALIAPDGRIVERSELDVAVARVWTVPLAALPEPLGAARITAFGPLALVAGGGLLAVAWWTGRSRSSPSASPQQR